MATKGVLKEKKIPFWEIFFVMLMPSLAMLAISYIARLGKSLVLRFYETPLSPLMSMVSQIFFVGFRILIILFPSLSIRDENSFSVASDYSLYSSAKIIMHRYVHFI